MKVYIVGKMTGLPDLGFSLFDEAKEIWERLGYTVVSPADMDRAAGFGPDNPPTKSEMRKIFAQDMAEVCSSDVIAAIPNWTDSYFGRIEVAAARGLGIPILDAFTQQEVPHVTSPSYS